MSGIRTRKKYQIRGFIIGVLVTAVLAGIPIGYILIFSPDAVRGKQAASEEKTMTVFRLTKKLEAGDTIKDSDLEEVKVSWEISADYKIKKADLVGQRLKLELSEGILLTQDFLYEGGLFGDDIRLNRYSFIKLTEKLKKGAFIDIRVSFPNGADFIVLSKKKIMGLSSSGQELESQLDTIPDTLWLEVTEEDILRLSSAAVDAAIREGTSIYAIQYVSDIQKPAAVTYPVNKTVALLLRKDPNISTRAYAVLEERLREELDSVPDKEEGTTETEATKSEIPDNLNHNMDTDDDQSEKAPEGDDEIIYFD